LGRLLIWTVAIVTQSRVAVITQYSIADRIVHHSQVYVKRPARSLVDVGLPFLSSSAYYVVDDEELKMSLVATGAQGRISAVMG